MMRGVTAASARGRAVAGLVAAGVVGLVALVGLVFWGAFSLLGSGGSQEASVAEPAVTVPETAVAVSPSPELVVADGTCVNPAEVDRSDPDKVAAAVMSIAFCFDSVLDTNTTDALRRAEPLLTENMGALLADNRGSRNALSAQFLEAGKQRGYTYTTVEFVGSDAHHHHEGESLEEAHDHARDDEGGVHVSTQYVKWTWVPRDGKGEMAGGYAVWTMNLVQDGAGAWAVDSFILGSFEPEF